MLLPKILLSLGTLFIFSLNTYSSVITYNDVKDPFPSSKMTDDQFLDLIEKRAFLFFWYEANPENGLIKDRAYNFNQSENRPDPGASIASVGFGITAICIGIEQGWVDKKTGYDRILTTLKYFRDKMENFDGFYYHFISMQTGKRHGASEVSTIDTSLFLCGSILAGEYFKGTEIETIAEELYTRVNWQKYLNNNIFISMGSNPEQGIFSYTWDKYCEGLILDILAIGSSSYPISASAWHQMSRQIGTYRGMTSIACGACFTHHYSQLYVDFRNMNDNIANYHINTILAMICNREYCQEKKENYQFNNNSWGLTACDAVDGSYKVFGAEPDIYKTEPDGTAAPTCIGATTAFVPTIAIPALRYLYDNHKDLIWGRYGFTDSYNLLKNWRSDWIIGIDQAAIMLACENYRSGFVWKYFMRNKNIQQSLKKIGFDISAGSPISLEGEWLLKKISHKNSIEEISQMSSGWQQILQPENLDYFGLKNYQGYFWLKKEFTLSRQDLKQFQEEELAISLGAVDDADETYLNGTKIGSGGKFPPDFQTAYNQPRVYRIKAEQLSIDKKNIIMVLVYNKNNYSGIFRGPLWIAPYKQLLFQSLKPGIKKEGKEIDFINLMNNQWKISIGDKKAWSGPDFNDQDWPSIYIPKSWTLSGFDRDKGYAWFRYHLTLYESWKKGIKKLYINSIADTDEFYFNGKLIGYAGSFPPLFQPALRFKREYPIPEELIKYNEENIIAVRVYSQGEKNGLWQGPILLKLLEEK